MAIKALTDAISDKETVFYIKDKGPITVEQVCNLYERYKVLHGEDEKKNRPAVRGLREEGPAEDSPNSLKSVRDAIDKMIASTGAQLEKLSASVAQLAGLHQAPLHMPTPPPTMLSTRAPSFQPLGPPPPVPDVPSTPCPRCRKPGHWARNCPSQLPPDTCFRCRQTGHRVKDCPMSLNPNGPGPAPGTRPSAPLH